MLNNDSSLKNKLIIIVVATFLIILFVIIFFILTGNKKNNTKDKIVLQYWGFDEEKPIQNITKLYKGKNNNTTVVYTKKGSTPEEYQKILNDALAAGEGPDLFQIRNDWLPMNYKKMAEMPESVYSESEYKKIFYPIAYSDLSYKNKIYAVPFYIDTLALYANLDILQKKGFNDFAGDLKKISSYSNVLKKINGTNIEIAGIALGTADNINNATDILYMLMAQNGATMTSPDNKTAYFNLSKKDRYGNLIYPSKLALDFYLTFSNPNNPNYTWNNNMVDSLNSFIDGKSAFYFGYAREKSQIDKATSNKLNYKVFNAPQQEGDIAYIAKYWATGVSKDSKNINEAWNFVKYFTKEEVLPIYIESANLPMARKDLNEKNYYFDDFKSIFIKQIPKATSWNKGNWEETDKQFKYMINNVLNGKYKTQEAIDNCSKEVTKILENINKE